MIQGLAANENAISPTVSIKRLRLCLVLSTITFSLWVAGLLAMYFFTVYPHRHPAVATPVQSVR